mmetsp:Transcript_17108/g.50544  ORF Transcript_17108/g.50544 Transcript_17108/m.50544 type:complete len:280 (+) Transcript_17108:1084-1923(+)
MNSLVHIHGARRQPKHHGQPQRYQHLVEVKHALPRDVELEIELRPLVPGRVGWVEHELVRHSVQRPLRHLSIPEKVVHDAGVALPGLANLAKRVGARRGAAHQRFVKRQPVVVRLHDDHHRAEIEREGLKVAVPLERPFKLVDDLAPPSLGALEPKVIAHHFHPCKRVLHLEQRPPQAGGKCRLRVANQPRVGPVHDDPHLAVGLSLGRVELVDVRKLGPDVHKRDVPVDFGRVGPVDLAPRPLALGRFAGEPEGDLRVRRHRVGGRRWGHLVGVTIQG